MLIPKRILLFAVLTGVVVSGYSFWFYSAAHERMPEPGDLLIHCVPSQAGSSTVLSLSDAESIARWRCVLGPDAPVTPWVPTPRDVARLEERLPSFLNTQHDVPKMRSLDWYISQYAGFVKDNRNSICVNFVDVATLDLDAYMYRHDRDLRAKLPKGVCPEDYWRYEPIEAVDGNVSYCGVAFDVGSGTFANLNCNGL